MYRLLSARYGWTVEQIAGMTWMQQLMYLQGDEADDGLMHFATMRDYQVWLASQDKG